MEVKSKVQKYDIHPDFRIGVGMPVNAVTLALGPILPKILDWVTPRQRGLTYRREKITSYDGAQIAVEIAVPAGVGDRAPCILYFHGGAFVIGGAPRNKNVAFSLAKSVSCKAIYVDYRLAGRDPFPAGVEDCYAALKWIHHNATQLGIDRERIVVYGESAGGALSAAVAQMARDRGEAHVHAQMLIYPVLDCSGSTESARTFTDTPIWRTEANANMWKVYLRDCRPPYSPYAAPMLAESLRHLPPAYIETAEFDPLRDEGIAYARRLQADGVHVELVETRRTVHGFDMIAKNEIVQESFQRRTEFLQKRLNDNSATDSR
jgi:acetyl esterase